MAFIIDKNGDITLIQGDSGELVLNNLPTDKNYTVYLGIQDKNRKPIGNELSVETNKNSTVPFIITGELTDLLMVPKGEDTESYYYGVKLCSVDGIEDTLLIGDSQIGDKNTITVYPKKVEGC